LAHHTPLEQISPLLDMQPGVVSAYAKMVAKYHPELLPAAGDLLDPQEDKR